MKRFLKFLLGLGLLAAAVAVTALLWITRPQAEKKEETVEITAVETLPVAYGPVDIELPSQGVVEAARRTEIAAEVGGKIVSVSDKFDPGGTFEAGEPLLVLDSSDYESALAQAVSTLAERKSHLAQEQARAAQAQRDWEKLGRGTPDELVLRVPQLESAKAQVAAAEAAVLKAERDLERTHLSAPFPATIASTRAELGGYLASGEVVAEVFQTSPFEVRLPLSIDEAQFLRSNDEGVPAGPVEISATAAGVTREWKANIVRTEREIDRSTRSLHVVAEIEQPDGNKGTNLQPGLFVEARIAGRRLDRIATIPYSAFLDLDRVVIVDEEDKIRIRDVVVVKRRKDAVLVSEGLREGELLCLTEIPDLVEGIKVAPRPQSEEPEGKTDLAEDDLARKGKP